MVKFSLDNVPVTKELVNTLKQVKEFSMSWGWVEEVNLTLDFGSDKTKDYGPILGRAFFSDNTIFINLHLVKSQTRLGAMLVHELRHFWQLQTGWDFSDYKKIEDGFDEYRTQEVEIDAFNLEQEYVVHTLKNN